MEVLVKAQLETGFRTDDAGYLIIHQNGNTVKLSCQQVQMLVELLEDGNGLGLEQDWNKGIEGD